EVSTSVSYYNCWNKGKYCQPSENQFRQHPLDYLESMEEAINNSLDKAGEDIRDKVVGIGVDTTGSTPGPVDEQGRPLALLDEFKDNPNAMFILWKDHTAVKEAEEINHTAKNWGGTDFTKYEGGVYSSEWFWAKIIHTIRVDEEVKNSAYSWVEVCDWIPAVLTDTEAPENMKRSRCAAGHKAMWNQEWDGLPEEEFLVELDPELKGIKERLYSKTYTSDKKAGTLTKKWADKLGLNPGIAVAVGAFDAHMGAVGGEISENTLIKTIGTSTCDVMVADYAELGDNIVEGICGQVDGSVIPGMIGLEAGQSAFGDVYAWFKDILSWPLDSILPDIVDIEEDKIEEIKDQILYKLTEEAKKLDIEETTLIALDWLNGRRTPFADQMLKGAIMGLNLGTTAPKIFKALVEATVFGSKVIADHFVNKGLTIDEVIAVGGISKKNDFVMQVTADVLNIPIKIASSDQTCALGAAMFAATAADLYDEVEEAVDNMGSGFSKIFYPREDKVEIYQKLYDKYIDFSEIMEDKLRNL
ncbi:MAG: ribulokinase, partial [Bacillota bacterium]